MSRAFRCCFFLYCYGNSLLSFRRNRLLPLQVQQITNGGLNLAIIFLKPCDGIGPRRIHYYSTIILQSTQFIVIAFIITLNEKSTVLNGYRHQRIMAVDLS
ncbi:hypothetical protein AVEN_65074-1 [Araneus ventricosus]|uniref:Uncharacterized protein n=1 Tax=Araneus ventricosus TaxID=182803 RepID=A0A4Y2F5V1_ARAVE|nr:hypothetical protein AVEN_65074-1 [Araneus ventricosus]